MDLGDVFKLIWKFILIYVWVFKQIFYISRYALGYAKAHAPAKEMFLPLASRFEHHHIVAGSGHGKTQLLQHLILRDIDELQGSSNEEVNEEVAEETINALPSPKSIQKIAGVIYCLLIISWLIPIVIPVAGIAAYATRKKAAGTIYASHIQNQITVFWVTFTVVFGGMIGANWLGGTPSGKDAGTVWLVIFILAAIYTLCRIGLGLYRVFKEHDYDAPPKARPQRKIVKTTGDNRSIIVIDSQGDMIQKIIHLREMRGLSDRLVLIDPNDIENPPALNLFDFGLDRLESYSPVEREKLINGAISLYEYLFGALLGAELTQRQGVIFRYLAILMMVVPGATIHTLMEFMQDPETVRPHLHKLDKSAALFFNTQFFSTSFDDTRQQILTRLWGVLSNRVLERMFSNAHNRVNLFEAMNRGSLILINTSKDLLKQDGCTIFGRFFIALITQAAQERSVIEESKRRATFLYVDEAQDYFDESVEQLFNQARKYKLGLIFAHQNLDQLSQKLRATVMASTSIKMVGGLSSKDADVFAKEMHCESEILQSMKKDTKTTQFMSYVRNQKMPLNILTVFFGAMEEREKITPREFTMLIESNRKRYSAPREEPPELPPTDSPLGVVDMV